MKSSVLGFIVCVMTAWICVQPCTAAGVNTSSKSTLPAASVSEAGVAAPSAGHSHAPGTSHDHGPAPVVEAVQAPSAPEAAAGEAPVVFFPVLLHEFEPVVDGRKTKYDFVVQNKGTAELKIIRVKTG